MAFESIKDIPAVGFGLWKIGPEICEDTVYEAIKCGYRHLDAACDYGNEVEVGRGIQRALADGICTREELWVTSKLWNTYHRAEHVTPALDRTLNDLQLEYLDLYLIHFPIALEFVPFETRYPPEWFFDPDTSDPCMKPSRVPLSDTWHSMEKLKAEGKAKHIGVCNYSSGLLHDLMNYCTTPPELLQIESHPYLTQEKLVRLAKQYGLEVTAFSPLGSLSYVELDMASQDESILEQAVVQEIASRLECSAAQVVLAWGVQRGTSVVVKSMNPERMEQNLAAAEIELSENDMQAISALNQNRRYNDPGVFCEGAFNTFHPIYD
ncbi:MAG: aldo/keto reductase [Gammaproteobacteria bacterium]|nr:aldo/keto reductase [Gammaproteobacteria bacterium]MDD9894227.1 aldo/keto reductase [Gammaproteobacteria bacterium]